MVPLEDEFGDVVGKARRGQGISLDDLAKDIALEVELIAAFEGYRRDPTREQSDALANHLGLDPGKLWEMATDAWVPRPVDTTLQGGSHVDQLWYEPDRVWAYVLGDESQCVLIDAGAPGRDIRQAIGTRELTAVLLTHTDVDHISSLGEVIGDTKTPVYVPEDEADAVIGKAEDVRTMVDGDHVKAGLMEFRVLHTPGHTVGESCLATGEIVFTGDALFAGSIGGTTLGPDAYPLHKQTVKDKVLTLPNSTKLFPGHGPQTTVAEELAHNPFF
jgi:glyoxylase-like metal-dependent hydrolase (beta-lactamase superfamily II)